jgi:DNA-binding transcriptional LysR family regulator
MKLNLNQMHMYVTVVEQRGFSAAARELNLSPTAISKQIKNLEGILGVQLVDRTSTRFEITDVGDLLYSHCKLILKDIVNLEDIVHSFKAEPSGKLSVFSTMAFAAVYITPHIKEFCALYPKVELTIQIEDRLADVQKEGIDLCFGLTLHWDLELIKKKLFSTPQHIYASPSYIESHGEPKNIRNLEDHRFICHTNRVDSTTLPMKDGTKIQVTPSIFVNDHWAFMSFAFEGLGLIAHADFVVKESVGKGQLKRVLLGDELMPVEFCVFFAPTPHRKPSAKVFLDFIVSKI